jgi:ABC-type microcin C transport system permease subunit YejE
MTSMIGSIIGTTIGAIIGTTIGAIISIFQTNFRYL